MEAGIVLAGQIMKVKALLYSDGSERSLSAAIYAAALMKTNPEMELTILTFSRTGPGESWDGWIDDSVLSSIGKEALAKTRRIFEERKLEVATIEAVETGKVARAIVDYAKKGGYNLIIVRTKGPSELRALVQGSIAFDVVQLSECPVLLVKKLPEVILAGLDQE